LLFVVTGPISQLSLLHPSPLWVITTQILLLSVAPQAPPASFPPETLSVTVGKRFCPVLFPPLVRWCGHFCVCFVPSPPIHVNPPPFSLSVRWVDFQFSFFFGKTRFSFPFCLSSRRSPDHWDTPATFHASLPIPHSSAVPPFHLSFFSVILSFFLAFASIPRLQGFSLRPSPFYVPFFFLYHKTSPLFTPFSTGPF